MAFSDEGVQDALAGDQPKQSTSSGSKYTSSGHLYAAEELEEFEEAVGESDADRTRN